MKKTIRVCDLCGEELKLDFGETANQYTYHTMKRWPGYPEKGKEKRMRVTDDVCDCCFQNIIVVFSLCDKIKDKEFKQAWHIFINSVETEIEKVYETRWDCAA